MMKQAKKVILTVIPFMLMALLILGYWDKPDIAGARHTINAVIGDESYIAMFGEKPEKSVPEQLRIRVHLTYVEQLLRERPTDHLSLSQQKKRAHYLNLLHDYIQAGQFPHNDGHPDQRRPTFIDENGNICAVGYLVAQSLGRATAKALNQNYKYAYVPEIDDPLFLKWAQKSGFTIMELAMIQPAYGAPPSREAIVKKSNHNEVNLSYAVGSTLLAGANVGYLTNPAQSQWIFDSPRTMHWFGLATGGGSVLLGILNLDNKQVNREPFCGFMAPCYTYKYIETNHLRTGISIANMGIGLVAMIRSAYHLLTPAASPPQQASGSTFQLTHLQTASGKPAPGIKFQLDF